MLALKDEITAVLKRIIKILSGASFSRVYMMYLLIE